jgi:hypothetical protein
MIIQAISKYLTKHGIKHTTYTHITAGSGSIEIPQGPNNYTIINNTKTHTLTLTENNYITRSHKEIDLADPQLLPKLLKVLQNK